MLRFRAAAGRVRRLPKGLLAAHYVMRTNFGHDDNFPGMQDRVKVEVLGINALGSVLTSPGGVNPVAAGASAADAQP